MRGISTGRRNNADGEIFINLCATALMLVVVALVGLLLLVCFRGLGNFWPYGLKSFVLSDGKRIAGAVIARECSCEESGSRVCSLRIKRAGRDVFGEDFIWVKEDQILSSGQPQELAVVERREWGDIFAFVQRFEKDDIVLADGWRAVGQEIPRLLAKSKHEQERLNRLEVVELRSIARKEELLTEKEQAGGLDDVSVQLLKSARTKLDKEYSALRAELKAERAKMNGRLVVHTADGKKIVIPVTEIQRVYFPNALTTANKLMIFFDRAWEFLSTDPRESNTEGGVFPAIFGTVMMVLLMSIVATPLGVLAAIYLREYAKQGFAVSMVRSAVNNLAGVPSIVFGVFGLGFFVYGIGGSIDKIFFADSLPVPTFGTGGIIWASLTLALLTVPTVIVATEEGLSAIPRQLREASYALGATKFETTWKVVIPALTPSILTGVILAISRAAGEVAPLMLTGVVKLAPSMPLDGNFPYVHLERKFMHLGFHIYDVGFQSPNAEAAEPMVYSTTLLLLVIVVCSNMAAISLRSCLRRNMHLSDV